MARFASIRHPILLFLAVVGLGEVLVLHDPTPAQSGPNAIAVAVRRHASLSSATCPLEPFGRPGRAHAPGRGRLPGVGGSRAERSCRTRDARSPRQGRSSPAAARHGLPHRGSPRPPGRAPGSRDQVERVMHVSTGAAASPSGRATFASSEGARVVVGSLQVSLPWAVLQSRHRPPRICDVPAYRRLTAACACRSTRPRPSSPSPEAARPVRVVG